MADHHLPHFPTPLVGRSAYLGEIAHLLVDPECRLLTLVGPGGIGKTRLAVAAAQQFDACDAVYFVPLQQVTETESLAGAIADAAGLRIGATDNPPQELLDQVREQAWLLVLDNFEHLVEEAALLSSLLRQAPRLRLLVTSRLRLNLLEEFVLEVNGLACPFSEHDTHLERSAAVELFIQRARHANAGFTLPPAHHHAVFRIVHLVEGMPLAIELAANWVRALSCDAIAGEIERSLDILESSGRNLQPRHRTMRAAFESTWQQLPLEQRAVFMRLSVFRGGFTREAASAVAGASLPVLSALIDQSLLRADEGGRYHVHELLRQYAQEWLEQDAAAKEAYEAHSAYYTAFLEARGSAIASAQQYRVLQEVTAEMDNIRTAWSWAVQQVNADRLQRAAYTLYEFCDFCGRYCEGADLFEQALSALAEAKRNKQNDLTQATLFGLNGWHYIRLGNYEKAAQVFERSLALFHALEMAPPPGYGTDPRMGLAFLATVQGNYAQAIGLAEEACTLAEGREDASNLQIGYYVQASAYYDLGDHTTAHHYATSAYQLAHEVGNQHMMAYVLIILGDVVRAQEKFQAAKQHYQRCFDLHNQLGNPEGMALAQLRLAELARLEQNYAQAAALYQQSCEIYRRINDPGGQVRALTGLGETALAAGNADATGDYFFQALALAASLHSVPLLLPLLTPIGELLAATGEMELAARAWTLIVRHAAGGSVMHQRAQQRLAQLVAARLAHRQVAAGEEHDDPFALAAQLHERLAIGLAARLPAPAVLLPPARPYAAPSTGGALNQLELVEPLSEREVEILRLLAQGYTNQQIADALTLVVGTVKAHNHHIFGKLGVSNRVQALARARELALI